jgi:membrane fusion protein (multidrug efflux system)
VSRGTVLVELDRAQTAAELAEAEANLSESRNQFNRGRDLAVTAALSRAQLDQLETSVKTAEARVAAARARLADTVIRAPFDGRTGFRRVSVGGLVSAGAVITTLDDTSVIKLEFTVPQSFLSDLAPGLAVEAKVDGLEGRVFKGKVATTIAARGPGHALARGARRAAEPRWHAAARHVHEREAARPRESHPRAAGAGAGAGRGPQLRVRRGRWPRAAP